MVWMQVETAEIKFLHNGHSPRFSLSQPATVGSLPTGGGAVGSAEVDQSGALTLGADTPHLAKSSSHATTVVVTGPVTRVTRRPATRRGVRTQERLTPPFVSLSFEPCPARQGFPSRAALAGLDWPTPPCPAHSSVMRFGGALIQRAHPRNPAATMRENRLIDNPPGSCDYLVASRGPGRLAPSIRCQRHAWLSNELPTWPGVLPLPDAAHRLHRYKLPTPPDVLGSV